MNVKLYSGIPFDSNNKIIFASSTVRSSALDVFKVLEFSNNARFINNDILEIDFSNDLSGRSVYRVNYAIIEQYGIELCYYIYNAVVLAGGTVRFNCRIDNWQTYLTAESQYVIDGNIQQTNIPFSILSGASKYLPIPKRAITDTYSFESLPAYQNYSQFAIIFLAATKDVVNVFVTGTLTSLAKAINYVREMGIITRCGSDSSHVENFVDVVISKAWIVPENFILRSALSTYSTTYFVAGMATSAIPQYRFIAAQTYTDDPLSYSVDDAGTLLQDLTANFSITTNEKDFVEVGTFTSRLALNTETASTHTGKIRIIISATGTVNITLSIEQASIDITNDFEVTVAYSESAQYYQHNQVGNALKQTGSLIGMGISIASGNAVGAVMSGLSFAKGAAGIAEKLNSPMTVINNGNAIHTLKTGIIGKYTATASNVQSIEQNLTDFGYIYENEHITFNYEGWENVGNVQKYIKFSTVRVGGNMPQNAREDIELTLKNGVRLFYVST